MNDDLAWLTATEALVQFQSRQVSPVELLQALVDRAATVEPRINAFSSMRLDAAFAAARLAEARYARGTPAGPLDGVPVALKNEHTLVGDSTTMGSALLRGVVDTKNSPVTQRLLDAGAVVHARTNVPEFYCAMFTRSLEYGVTRNPWKLTESCGGSSGGSGAALAAGLTTLATGSDIAGSIRIPAAACGIVGFKPSYGRVPEAMYEFALNTYNHSGPMARSVADCALMFDVLQGPHPDDPACIPCRAETPLQLPDLAGLRVALSYDLGFFDVDPRIAANTSALAGRLRDLGASVDEVAVGWDRGIAEAAAAGLGFNMGRVLAGWIGKGRDACNDYTLQFADAGMRVTPEAYLEHIRTMGNMDVQLQRLFGRFDLLLCPTLAVPSMPADGPANPFGAIWATAMTYPFNMLSRHPVLNVPSGLLADGVPTGVQLVGRRYQDAAVLAVGLRLEREMQWQRMHPSSG